MSAFFFPLPHPTPPALFPGPKQRMPNRKREKDRDNQGWQRKILRMEQTEHDRSREKKMVVYPGTSYQEREGG